MGHQDSFQELQYSIPFLSLDSRESFPIQMEPFWACSQDLISVLVCSVEEQAIYVMSYWLFFFDPELLKGQDSMSIASH